MESICTKAEALAASLEYFDGDALAAGVFVDKYALRDQEGNFHERTYDDMARRLSREFARIERKYPQPLSEDEIFNLFTKGEGYVQDAGLKTGIICPQGSPMFGIGNPFQMVSTSNCAVFSSPEDTISGIMDAARGMANLYKRRFGVGIDISTLRPDGANVNNSAVTSTGAWSFADFFSYVTRMIGQNSRRGALMLTMSIKHPDIEKFVTMKQDLTKVTGANVSVRITDDFMFAVQYDEEWVLQFPVDVPLGEAKFTKTVRARELFQLIADVATKSAEPGVLFWDEILRSQPLAYYDGFEPTSTNPCAELALPPGDSCRLISLYLAPFVQKPFTPEAYFDIDAFRKVVRLGQRLSDDLVDLELEALTRIRSLADTDDERAMFDMFIEKCGQGRRTGLGTHGLADALARMGIQYGSAECLASVRVIYEALKLAAYASSTEMAKERGAFPIFDWDTEADCSFFASFPDEYIRDMMKHGRRNGALLTNAPTGTRSILSENCSSGIEPVFANYYTRRRKIDRTRDDTQPDMIDAVGDGWKSYKVFHPNIKRFLATAWDGEILGFGIPNEEALWAAASAHTLTFGEFVEQAELPAYFITANDLGWASRVAMQATLQKQICHSLSSTVNLPRGTSSDVVAQIYMEAWKQGCKGITVYVDGSREAQVLTVDPTPTTAGTVTMPSLGGTTSHMVTDAQLITQLEVENGSLRAALDGQGSGFPTRGLESEGAMTKTTFTSPVDGEARKVYVYVGKNPEEEIVEVFVIDEKGDEDYPPYAAALGRLASLALKYGVAADEVAYTLRGLKGGSMSFRQGGMATSVPDLVAQLLLEASGTRKKKGPLPAELPGIPSASADAVSLRICKQCGEVAVKEVEGCATCINCGASKCG